MTYLIRVESEGVDLIRSGLYPSDRFPFPPVPHGGHAMVVGTHRAQKPAVVTEVEATDLEKTKNNNDTYILALKQDTGSCCTSRGFLVCTRCGWLTD